MSTPRPSFPVFISSRVRRRRKLQPACWAVYVAGHRFRRDGSAWSEEDSNLREPPITWVRPGCGIGAGTRKAAPRAAPQERYADWRLVSRPSGDPRSQAGCNGACCAVLTKLWRRGREAVSSHQREGDHCVSSLLGSHLETPQRPKGVSRPEVRMTEYSGRVKTLCFYRGRLSD